MRHYLKLSKIKYCIKEFIRKTLCYNLHIKYTWLNGDIYLLQLSLFKKVIANIFIKQAIKRSETLAGIYMKVK